MKSPILIFMVLLLSGLLARSDEGYVQEIDDLINSISDHDQSYMQLNLKLANELVSDPPPTKWDQYRKRAINIYEKVLTGYGRRFDLPDQITQNKIRFQLARLYIDEGLPENARAMWFVLVNHKESPDLARESALKLGDWVEAQGGSKPLNEAKKYYGIALSLCQSTESCSYGHYRLSWVYHKQNLDLLAVNEIQKSLWNNKGEIREEALRDLMIFLGGLNEKEFPALDLVKSLAKKLNRPSLLIALAQSQLSAGNRLAGIAALNESFSQTPTLYLSARLLEEYYTIRDWTSFQNLLNKISQTFSQNDATPDVENILHRLSVQMDGERLGQTNYSVLFKNLALFYLRLFPMNTNKAQLIQSYLACEQDSQVQMQNLQKWIGEEKQARHKDLEIELRKRRAFIAQTNKIASIIIGESEILSHEAKSHQEKREFIFQKAKAYYDLKDYESAAGLFLKLSEIDRTPDRISLTSEHLLLDIYAQKKDFAKILNQSQRWTLNPQFSIWVTQLKDLSAELTELKSIAQNSEFELAVSQGNNKNALETFKKFCLQNIKLPQSCENARIVSVNTKNEPSLLWVLEKQGKDEELINELEASGHFAQAAQRIEDRLLNQIPVRQTASKHFPKIRIGGQILTKSSADIHPAEDQTFLRAALLYELGGESQARDRIFQKLMSTHKKDLGKNEDLIFDSLKNSQYLSLNHFSFSWKSKNRLLLAEYLEESGRGNKLTHNLLVNSCQNGGLIWEKTAVDQMKMLDQTQRKITFYGAHSKHLFQKRISALKNLSTKASCYLQGADSKLRVVIESLVAWSFYDLAKEITAASIPSAFSSAQILEVKNNLDKMAQPFEAAGKKYDDLAHEAFNEIPSLIEKTLLANKISKRDISGGLFYLKANNGPSGKTSHLQRENAISQLNQDPNSLKPLEELKNYYEAQKRSHLASYFQGRLKMNSKLEAKQ